MEVGALGPRDKSVFFSSSAEGMMFYCSSGFLRCDRGNEVRIAQVWWLQRATIAE